MNQNNFSQQKLKEILAHQKYEELEPYQKTATWKSLNHEDRHSLAALFVMRGEKQLAQTDKNGIESFRIATRITPKDPALFFRIGCIYLSHRTHYALLKLAEEAFCKVIELEEHHFSANLCLGEVYTALGSLQEDESYYQKADVFFGFAFNQIKDERDDLARLYWQWGVLWFHWGKLSGESSDYVQALEKFRRASDIGIESQRPQFWAEYGTIFMELAPQLNKTDLYLEAVDCYHQAVRDGFDYFEGWLGLANAYRHLFEAGLSESDFNQSEECYKMAGQLNPSSSQLYAQWGSLLYQGGKFYRDLELALDSLTKFEQAQALDPDLASIGLQWALSLMLYGSLSENVNKIQEAKQKIAQTLQKEPDACESWYYYGLCLLELGKYFADDSFFVEAIEKFNHGLALKKNDPNLLYGLASAYFLIGDINDSATELETSTLLFSKSEENFDRPSRQFWNDWGVVLMRWAEVTNDKSHVFGSLEKFDKALEDNLVSNREKGIDPEWLYNYGCAWDFLGDFQEDSDCYEHAIAALTKVIELDPTFSHARYNLALAYAHFGELCLDIESFHKSIEQFQALLSQDCEDDMGWNDYGITLIHLSQLIQEKTFSDHAHALYELAESKLLQAAALGNIQSYYNLACLYSLMNKHSYAMHFLEKAEEADALPPLKEIYEDEWLEALRHTQAFHNFVSNLPPSKRQGLSEEGSVS